MAGKGKTPPVELEVGDHTVRLSSPDRVYFPASGATKLDLAKYYLSVGDGIVRALRERPCMLHRFPDGVSGEKVHQKRVPNGAPPWLETVRLHFPRFGRHADELCVTKLADVDPRDFTIATVPKRFADLGDPHATIDDEAFSLDPLLEWAERDERSGAGDPQG